MSSKKTRMYLSLSLGRCDVGWVEDAGRAGTRADFGWFIAGVVAFELCVLERVFWLAGRRIWGLWRIACG